MTEIPKPNDFKEYEIRTQILGHFGLGISKAVYCVCNPYSKRVWFEIEQNRVEVAVEPYLTQAIKLFNELR